MGPHRDDLELKINDRSLHYENQEQHRLFMCILKMAQVLLLSKKTKKFPILLIDDILNDLDSQNINPILRFIKDYKGQVFVTSPNKEQLNPLFLDYINHFCHHNLPIKN